MPGLDPTVPAVPARPVVPAGPAVGATAAAVHDALDRLHAALADLSAADLGGLTLADSAALALGTTAARRAMDAVDARALQRLTTCGVWEVEGFRSPAAWMSGRTNEATGSVYSRLRGAQRVARHPVLAEALAQGAITMRHVDAVAEAHRRYPSLSRALDDIEPELAAFAADATPEELRRRLSATMHRIDPEAVDREDSRRRELDAGVHVSSLLDGWGKVDALLPPEIHAKFLTALDAALAATHGAAADQGPATDAGPPTPPRTDVDDSPRRRRRLTAFDLILDAAIAATGGARLPDLGGVRPLISIVCPVDTALADPHASATPADVRSALAAAISVPGSGPNASTGPDADWDDDELFGRMRRSARTGPGLAPAWLPRTRGLVGARTLRRMLCDAAVRRLIVDPGGRVVDVGRTTRVISAHMRAAVEARDGWRCRFPGCRHPIHQIHHVVPWSQGGPTDRSNLVGLCFHHHVVIHQDGWRVTGDADVEVTVSLDGLDGESWSSPAPGIGAVLC